MIAALAWFTQFLLMGKSYFIIWVYAQAYSMFSHDSLVLKKIYNYTDYGIPSKFGNFLSQHSLF